VEPYQLSLLCVPGALAGWMSLLMVDLKMFIIGIGMGLDGAIGKTWEAGT